MDIYGEFSSIYKKLCIISPDYSEISRAGLLLPHTVYSEIDPVFGTVQVPGGL